MKKKERKTSKKKNEDIYYEIKWGSEVDSSWVKLGCKNGIIIGILLHYHQRIKFFSYPIALNTKYVCIKNLKTKCIQLFKN